MPILFRQLNALFGHLDGTRLGPPNVDKVRLSPSKVPWLLKTFQSSGFLGCWTLNTHPDRKRPKMCHLRQELLRPSRPIYGTITMGLEGDLQ
jgi:hypothetical protein